MAHRHAGVISKPPPYTAWYTAWQAAYNAAAAGQGQAHIVCYGDSVTQGFYSTTPYYTYGWAGRLKTALGVATGVTTGTGFVSLQEEFAVGPADDRLTAAGSWTDAAGSSGLFGHFYYADAVSDTMTFGALTCSAFRIWYATTSGGGSFRVKVDGATINTYSCNAADSIQMIEVSAGAAGSHTLLLEWVSGNAYIIGVESISNPTTGVKISVVGEGGAQCSQLVDASSALASRYVVQAIDCDLAIIEFGLNEALNSTSAATFKTNMTTLITDLQALGASVLILVAPPPNPSFISTWSTYQTAMYELSSSLQCGILDMADYWTSYSANQPYYYDNVHPNPPGHVDMARVVSNYILSTIGSAPASSTFNPLTDVSNIALWLDASDDASFTYSSGTSVSQWNDKSGAARHFTQPTAGNQPTRSTSVNGLKSVRFDGTDDYLTAGDVLDLGTSDVSIFVVARFDTPSQGILIGKYKISSSPGSYLLYLVSSSGMKLETVYNAGSATIVDSAATTSTNTRIWGTIINRAAGSITQRIAKATDGTGSFTGDSASSRNVAQSLVIGALRNSADTAFVAGNYLQGAICEVLVYLRAVDSTERDAIESYLTTKWNLAI